MSYQLIWFEFLHLIIIAVFWYLNLAILIQDIRYRRIPNKLLLLLLALLPFWLYIHNSWILGQFILGSIFVISLTSFGILLYRENSLIGAGDIKYGAILILYLTGYNISIYIQNIGILTLLCLSLWWGYIFLQIIQSSGKIKNIWLSAFPKKIQPKEIRMRSVQFLLEWCVVWWLITLWIQAITNRVFEYMPLSWDVYFMIVIFVFLIRPAIRSMLFYWKYGIFPILAIILYIWHKISTLGWAGTISEWTLYIENAWIYILVFSGVYILTEKTFAYHDNISEKDHNNQQAQSTIPYSIILFLAFVISYIWNVTLMSPILKILSMLL